MKQVSLSSFKTSVFVTVSLMMLGLLFLGNLPTAKASIYGEITDVRWRRGGCILYVTFETFGSTLSSEYDFYTFLPGQWGTDNTIHQQFAAIPNQTYQFQVSLIDHYYPDGSTIVVGSGGANPIDVYWMDDIPLAIRRTCALL